MQEDDFRRELLGLLSDLDAVIASYQPRCDASGRCCRFDEFGHTLFLSSEEAELLLEPGLPSNWKFTASNCPYQVQGLCTARDRRPIGCRVFFCDPGFAEKQSELSEAFLGKLKRLHREFDRNWDYRPLHHFIERRLALQPPSAATGGAAVHENAGFASAHPPLVAIVPLHAADDRVA